jgi:segregation and condensation protein A
MHLRLQSFDGPLDLLLHLIKAHELNIFNIPMALITEQFLGFLRQVPELDFHQAGEYLAMAAQLIEVKAAMLIPALQNKIADEAQSLSEMDEQDPRKPLVEQLLEREAIRMACEHFDKLALLGRDVFPSGEHLRRAAEFEDADAPIKGNPFSLVIAFEQVLLQFARTRNAPMVKVNAQKITIQSKMSLIKRRFEIAEEFTLREFFDECESRYELIVTLMAVLELSKANHLNLAQAELFGPIFLTRGARFYDEAPELEGENETEAGATEGVKSVPKPSGVVSSKKELRAATLKG